MVCRYAAIAMALMWIGAAPSLAAPKKGPAASKDPNEIARLKGEQLSREQEAKSRRWDAEMNRMMRSICRGC